MSSTRDSATGKTTSGEYFPVLYRHDDFDAWVIRMEMKLRHNGEWDEFCSFLCEPPDATLQPHKHQKYMKKMGKAYWHIVSMLDNELLKIANEYKTLYEVLQRLKDVFYGYTQLNCAHQFRHVTNLRYKKGNNLLQHIQEMKIGFAKLDNMGVFLPSSILPHDLIMSLDGAYDRVLQPYLVNSLSSSNSGENQLKVDTIVKLLDATYFEEAHNETNEGSMQEERRPQGYDTTEFATTITAVRDKIAKRGANRGANPAKCFHCGQKGHFIRECHIYKRKQNQRWRKPLPCRNRQDWYHDDRDPTKSKRSRDQTHLPVSTPSAKSSKRCKANDQQSRAMLCANEEESGSSEYAEMAIAGRCESAERAIDVWVLDSGTSRHMTWQKESMVSYKAISTVVHVGGGHELHVDGVGDIQVELQTQRGSYDLWLRTMYYVPQLQYNLFSGATTIERAIR